MKDETFRPNRVLSYFQEEWKILFFVTVSGLIYNLGLLAGPWFEGKMTGKLVDLLGGTGTFHQMLMLVTAYVVSIGIVQVSRYFKRFYVTILPTVFFLHKFGFQISGFVKRYNFSRSDIADEFGADRSEGAAFRGENPGVVPLSDAERF